VIHILTGPVHSGKTTLLKKIIPLLKEKGIKIDGYLSESVWKNNECFGYRLTDLKNRRSYPFILREGKEEWEKIGPFFLVPDSLSRAKEIIRRTKNSDLAVVDEVGPLELAGKGVWPSLTEAFSSPRLDLLLVIRDSVLDEFCSIFERDKVLLYPVTEKKNPKDLASSLSTEIAKRRSSRPS
jgi:nucleoside-triphosphatase THEP1